ncbi:MAG TPA: glycosyltransferase N-terminal domain-containing protein [Planctomycetota bacterium]|nr:glycosyltransferase N-terminal domain-containing protein [Planctomycetota bacterium]
MSVAVDDGSRRLGWRLRCAFIATLYLIATPLLLIGLAHRLWIRRKGLVGLREKLTGAGPALTPGQVLVHGVSLGEVMLMRPLVPQLEAALGARCLLATTTETGRAALDEHFPANERAFWPLDLPWAVETFLARAKPRLVVLLELELWPYLLSACAARGIPVALVNARLSSRSFARWRAVRAFARPLMRSLTLALGQNATWTARLAALGARDARVTGSMKADMVRAADADAARDIAQRLGFDGRPLLLLASTSAGGAVEELVALPGGVAPWRARGWRVAVCPRHPERGPEVLAALVRAGACVRRSSLGERVSDDGEIMVIDEIGRLAALYAHTAATGGIAVVGGSLGSGRGGQNMLEAAAAGCCVVVGRDTRNFPDAMALLREADGVVETDGATIGDTLAALADDPARRRALGDAGRRAWLAGHGATARAVAALAEAFAAAPDGDHRACSSPSTSSAPA